MTDRREQDALQLSRRRTLVLVILFVGIFFLLLVGHSAPAQTPPSSPSPRRASQADLQRINTELRMLERSADTTAAELKQLRSSLARIGGLGAIVLALASFFGYQTVRGSIRRVVERNLQSAVAEALASRLPSILADTQRRAEDFLLKLAKLLALRAQGAYDEALSEYGWDGNVASLRNETPSIRRAIIECLYSARIDRPTTRASAWEAITELIQDDESPETNRLYLRIAVNTRRYREGLTFLDRTQDQIRADKQSSLRAATLLRRVGRLDEALEFTERYETDDDFESIVTVAVLKRDLGRFDNVHDTLLPAVRRLISQPSGQLPDGWHRVVNTFIANALDRGHPEDAVQSAEFVMRSSPGPVEVFTVGRVILSLAAENPNRSSLLERFRDVVPRLMPGEATVRCEALLLEIDGKREEAVELLRESVKQGTRPQGEGMNPDVYFQRCGMARVLIDLGRPADAIDALMPAASFNYGGEAKFQLAVAYAHQGEARDAARWLNQAVTESPKWAAHARDHDRLRTIPEVAEELARLGRL